MNMSQTKFFLSEKGIILKLLFSLILYILLAAIHFSIIFFHASISQNSKFYHSMSGSSFSLNKNLYFHRKDNIIKKIILFSKRSTFSAPLFLFPHNVKCPIWPSFYEIWLSPFLSYNLESIQSWFKISLNMRPNPNPWWYGKNFWWRQEANNGKMEWNERIFY